MGNWRNISSAQAKRKARRAWRRQSRNRKDESSRDCRKKGPFRRERERVERVVVGGWIEDMKRIIDGIYGQKTE